MESQENLRRRLDAVWERTAEADLVSAQARVKALKARKAVDKAEKEEREAEAACYKLRAEWRSLHDDLAALQSGEAAS